MRPGQMPMSGMGGRTGQKPRYADLKGLETVRAHTQQRYLAFISWLEKNYPEEAEKLAKLRTGDSDVYLEQMRNIWKRFRAIMQAEEENPKIAEVLKEDLLLKDQRDRILARIKSAPDNKMKNQLTEQLKEIVASRFDLIVKRKQLKYDQLRTKLQQLQKQAKQSEARLQQLEDSKDKQVEQRLKALLEESEMITWD